MWEIMNKNSMEKGKRRSEEQKGKQILYYMEDVKEKEMGWRELYGFKNEGSRAY
jgi:hypothetical protein